MPHSCFIYSSTDGHLGCFPNLTTVNNAAMYIGVLIFFCISVLDFFGLNSQKWNHWIIREFHFLNFFWGNSTLLSTVAASICIPTNSARGFPHITVSHWSEWLPSVNLVGFFLTRLLIWVVPVLSPNSYVVDVDGHSSEAKVWQLSKLCTFHSQIFQHVRKNIYLRCVLLGMC